MSSVRKISVTAQLLAPVAIKRDRQSERSASVRSVAGTLVRGALAALYLHRHGQADATFGRVFLNEATCRFGPLDPEQHIFPLTAASCKRERLRHALVDLLWLRVAQHHSAPLTEEAEASWRRCTQCGADLKAQDGFWRDDGTGPSETTGERHEAVSHVGIDRRTGTAAESMFYTLEALTPSGADADLYGWIRADDEALDTVQRLLQAEDGRVSIGHARTRGYGDVLLRLQLDEPAAGDVQDSQKRVDHWTRWNGELTKMLAAPPFSLAGCAPDGFFFGLSFPTGAVLVDRFLRYTLDPAEMIDWLPPMPAVAAAFPLQNRIAQHLDTGGTVRWIAAVAKHERLRGWNAAHGLPRQDEWMVARGAAYVYRFEGAQHQREALFKRLGALSAAGVGLRRNEGFGVVAVSDDFHRRFQRQEAQQCTC